MRLNRNDSDGEFEAEWITFVRQRFSIDNNQEKKNQATNCRKEKSIPKSIESALKEKNVEHLRSKCAKHCELMAQINFVKFYTNFVFEKFRLSEFVRAFYISLFFLFHLLCSLCLCAHIDDIVYFRLRNTRPQRLTIVLWQNPCQMQT